MNSLELKNILIQRISEINDINFLKALKTIIEFRSDQQVMQLTPEQKKDLEESIKDYEQGMTIDSETLNEEFTKWQNGK